MRIYCFVIFFWSTHRNGNELKNILMMESKSKVRTAAKILEFKWNSKYWERERERRNNSRAPSIQLTQSWIGYILIARTKRDERKEAIRGHFRYGIILCLKHFYYMAVYFIKASEVESCFQPIVVMQQWKLFFKLNFFFLIIFYCVLSLLLLFGSLLLLKIEKQTLFKQDMIKNTENSVVIVFNLINLRSIHKS